MTMRLSSALGFALLLVILPSCKGKETSSAPAGGNGDFKLTSRAFANGEAIPKRFTCDGKNVSPPLAWSGAPTGSQSFTLVVDDPDAPSGTFTHWIVFNLPAGTSSLAPRMTAAKLPAGAEQGVNDFGKPGYGGPCPPSGEHRYIHHLYALDTKLTGLSQPRRQQIDEALKGHVLGEATLMGRCAR
jgi:Raf kinase inhibitor-like YbhB/YbcL family protein